MKNIVCGSIGMLIAINTNAGTVCSPDNTTAFNNFDNMAFRITNDNAGTNSLFSQCTNLSNEVFLADLSNCAPLPLQPINGLGLNPNDKLLYGFAPTDGFGFGTHLDLSNLPFPNPGPAGDIMQADNVALYKIGNDGGFENIGTIQPPTETSPLPADEQQVVPIVHSAATFNQAGDLFVLAYRTNYLSTGSIPAMDAQVQYLTPHIVIGEIASNNLLSANGGLITTTWTDIDDTTDPECNALVTKFKDDTNLFSTCVVAEFIANGNDGDAAVQTCFINTAILDKGLHDFAVSPTNGHFYAYDSMTFDNIDVLIDVDPATNIASCTNIADAGNSTGVLSSLMFSKQNKLVAIFANQTTGNWINTADGTLTALAETVTSAAFSDGSSLPFAGFLRNGLNKGAGIVNLIFKNGFEQSADLIFKNGFELPIAGNADMTLIKQGTFIDSNNDGLAQVDETINYSFIVSNTGDVELTNLTINDPLISVNGSLASLAVMGVDNATFFGTYALTQNDIDNGMVSNSANLNASDPLNNSLSTASNNGVALITSLPTSASVTLLKQGEFNDSNNDGLAQVGETIDYSFEVTNIGNLTLNTVTITDPLINVIGTIATLDSLAVDNSTFVETYTLTQGDIDNGSVTNKATVNAIDPNNNNVSATSNTEVTNLPSSASIQVTKIGAFIDTNNDGTAQVNETINYSFIVTNTGNLTLSNVTISDPLIVNIPGSIANLLPNAIDNSTFSFAYALTQGDIDNGFVSNLALVSATDPENNIISSQSNNGIPLITNFVPVASMSLVKIGSFNDANNDGLAQVNETIDYSFVVTNNGSFTLNTVSIDDPLITVAGALASLNVAIIDNSTFNGTYTITQNDIDDGFVTNLATVNAFDPANNPVSEQSNLGFDLITNLPTSASMSLVKTGDFEDENNDGFAQAGETISYIFNITNTGNLTLSNVTVADPLITIAGSIATFAVGGNDSVTFTGTYILTPADINAGFVSNTANANAFDPANNNVSTQSNNDIVNLTIFSCPEF